MNKLNQLKKIGLGVNLLLLSLTAYANTMGDYDSLTDYLAANQKSYTENNVNSSALNEEKSEGARGHFIMNDCDCEQYLTVVEKELENSHNKRVELWIPQDGMIVNHIYTQAHHLDGEAQYSKKYRITSHKNNHFDREVDPANLPNCEITFNLNQSADLINC